MKRWSLVTVALALAVVLAFPAALSVVGQTPTPGAPAGQTPGAATPAPTIPADQALVRVVHAAAGVGPVNVNTGAGDPVFCNLAFKGATRYVAVAPGTFSFNVVPVGAAAAPAVTGTPEMTPTGVMTPTTQATGAMTPTTAVGGPGPGPQAQTTQTPGATPGAGTAGIPGSADLTGGQAYSLVAIGRPDNVETLPLTDDLTPPPAGQAKVRFVHASPDAPAVDVAVTGAATPIFANVAFRSATNYETVAAGTVDLQVRAAGSNNVVLTVPGVTLTGGATYTIYAVGLAEGEPALQALLAVESVGGVPVPSNPTR